MKALLRATAVIAVAAALTVPCGLAAKDKDQLFVGFKGGFSLLEDPSVEQSLFPGRYPNRPVFSVFLATVDHAPEKAWWDRTGVSLEVGYVNQVALYDVIVRDELGNIIETYPERVRRQYLQILDLGKLALRAGRRVTPLLLLGTAMNILLNTSRTPGYGSPLQASFKGVVFSFVIGAGLEFEIGRQLFNLEVRYDWGFDSFGFGRADPKPDSLMFVIGTGWKVSGK